MELTSIKDLYFKVTKVACGLKHTLLLNDKNQVYAAGDNSTGNLGQGHQYSSDIPLKVHGMSDVKVANIAAGRHSAVLTSEGGLIVWGPALDPSENILEPQELRADKRVMQVCVGERTSALINQEGHIYTWGLSNDVGQLGIREENGQSLPVLVS